jgi:SH3-like domain-containing protein
LLADLLIDSRGSRAGFPVRIVDELHELRKLRECAGARDRIGDRLLRAAGRSIGRLTGFPASQF